jgi:hypothetical protein
MQFSPTARLADHLLPEGLEAFIGGHRQAGRSWRWIARELGRRTDWAIDVAHETVRAWAGKGSAAA